MFSPSVAATIEASSSTLAQCRCCLAPQPYRFLPLGDHSPAQMLIRPEDLGRPQPTFALNPQVCLDCGLIQVADQIPADFFRHYLYVPSGAATMHSHFGDFAAILRREAGADGLIVDIGCNDGLLLAACNQLGCKTLGVDPAANIAELARRRGVDMHVDYFDPRTAEVLLERHGAARMIVTSNTFNHIGDLHTFMRGIDILLADDGTFVIEVPRAKELIEGNEFDNIYHEHVSEFSLLSVVRLGEYFDLAVTDVHRLPHIHGGSMRVFLRREATKGEIRPIVREMLDEEIASGMLRRETYDGLVSRVGEIGSRIRAMLDELKAQGLKIAGYGASARGNTLLTYFGIDGRYLDYLVDKNPLKQGLYSPNTRIPIKSLNALASEPPDVLLVLAWNFFDEIRSQQADFAARGGRFLVPLPEPILVS
ncbi:MAG TPA: class I SAM-dependent methyltransferase [Sphingomonas sp.]|nr:class I SAM-dependent methyltransferase [Sphingomonas sp.]